MGVLRPAPHSQEDSMEKDFTANFDGFSIKHTLRKFHNEGDFLDAYEGRGSAKRWAKAIDTHRRLVRESPRGGFLPDRTAVLTMVIPNSIATYYDRTRPGWIKDKKFLNSIRGMWGVAKSDSSTVSFSGAASIPNLNASTSTSSPDPTLIA